MLGCVLRIACLSFTFLEKFLALEIRVRPPPRTEYSPSLFHWDGVRGTQETWWGPKDMLKNLKTDTPLWKRCKGSLAVPSIIQIVCEKRCLVTADQAGRQSPEPKAAPKLYFDSSDVLRWLGSLLPLWCTLRSCWSYQPVFSGAVLDAWRRTFIDHAPDTPEHDLYSEQAIVEGVKQFPWKYDDSLLQDTV